MSSTQPSDHENSYQQVLALCLFPPVEVRKMHACQMETGYCPGCVNEREIEQPTLKKKPVILFDDFTRGCSRCVFDISCEIQNLFRKHSGLQTQTASLSDAFQHSL